MKIVLMPFGGPMLVVRKPGEQSMTQAGEEGQGEGRDSSDWGSYQGSTGRETPPNFVNVDSDSGPEEIASALPGHAALFFVYMLAIIEFTLSGPCLDLRCHML
jgi:hypothetical protein